MIAWVSRIIMIFLVLTIIYVVLSVHNRWRERQRLQAKYDSTKQSDPRDEFLAKGLQSYDRSAKPKLILGVFILPIAVVGVLLTLAHLS